MPKQRISRVAERTQRWLAVVEPVLREELAAEVVRLVGIDPLKRPGLLEQLDRIALEYHRDKAFYDWLAPAAEGKDATTKMIVALHNAVAAIDCVPPENLAMVGDMANRVRAAGFGPSTDVHSTRTMMVDLAKAANVFLAQLLLTRGARGLLALEEAVRKLLPLLKAEIDLAASIEHRQKTGDSDLRPMLTKPIKKLLSEVDPRLTTVSVSNMIGKVATRLSISEDPVRVILRANPDLALAIQPSSLNRLAE